MRWRLVLYWGRRYAFFSRRNRGVDASTIPPKRLDRGARERVLSSRNPEKLVHRRVWSRVDKKAVHSMLEKIKLPEYLNVAKQEFANCKCFDVPFMRVLQKLPGARTFHSPNTFLDSCQDCGDNRALLEVPIVACHAATLFRDRNPHAGSKASRGGDGYFEYSEIRTYLRPKRFEDASPEQRRTHFDDLCAHSSKQQQPFAPAR